MLWHPELVRAAQQIIAECRECQLIKKPSQILPDLKPDIPPPPLFRWAIDFTTVAGHNILVAVEYATGFVETDVTENHRFLSTTPILKRIV